MKILMITRLFHPNIGGVEVHVKNISKVFLESGHDVFVVTEKYSDRLKDNEKVILGKNIKGIKIIRIKYPKIKFLGLIIIWVWFIKNIRFIRSFDVVQIHDVFIWFLPLVFLIPNQPVFTTFHGWEGIYPIPFKNILIKRISAYLSDGVIGVGKRIEKHFGIKPDLVVWGAVDFKKYNSKKEPKTILYLGRLDKDTSIEIFLKAFKKLKGFRISFCGDGNLANKCREIGVVYGFCSNPQKYLSKAEYVFCSGYLSIMEAFSQKCIVFSAWNNPIRKDILEMTPFRKWINIANSSSQVVKIIQELEKDKGKKKKLIKNSYNWVKNKSWSALAQKYLNLWESEINL